MKKMKLALGATKKVKRSRNLNKQIKINRIKIETV